MSAVTLPSLEDSRVVAMLRQGCVGVIPTDTVYGLAALATNKDATTRLYSLKDRERKPGTIIAANVEQLIGLGLDEATLRAVSYVWPNPLSIVIPVAASSNYLDQGIGSLAVRIPKHGALHALLEQTGPLVTSSANHPGMPPANTLEEAKKYFADRVDLYVEGGNRSGLPPSTVARYNDGRLEVLRSGAVIINEEGIIV